MKNRIIVLSDSAESPGFNSDFMPYLILIALSPARVVRNKHTL